MKKLKAPELPESTIPQSDSTGDRLALREFVHNLATAPRAFRDSLIRHGRPTSDRAKSQTVFTNFFLHILPTRTHLHAIKATTTFGLGVATFVLFVILCITGVLLMVYYKPSVDQAYTSMLDIIHVVPTGRFIRNVHRWSAHAMVACVILHMTRAFYTSAYKHPRQFNWVIGMSLFVITLGLSFTGYLLPWDQLAYWAVTIGANIAQSPQELTDALGITQYFHLGRMLKELLLGSHYVGQEALIRFYVLHIIVLPVITTVLIGLHFWRIRKDGGLARPIAADAEIPGMTPTGLSGDEHAASLKTYGLMGLMRGTTPQVNREIRNTIPTWPGVLYVIGTATMFTVLAMLLLGAFFDAPLKEMADAAVPENPAKAPWYFLGLQELVSYSAFMGGVGIPAIVVLGLALVPYLDREPEDVGIWFSGRKGTRIALWSLLFSAAIVIGMLCFTVNFGWLRNWHATADVPQIVITLFNPGTVFVFVFAGWSIMVVKTTNSTRMGAIALFTCFLVGFAILTYFATVHRGPNWEFYWSQADWPAH
ncbi:MAG: cytochrome b N-terminal domain-containing protein [Planctomycetes bacterium]|nr:cytochrome b N-terminal domain-containing protein [Planctomycetota bacterium]